MILSQSAMPYVDPRTVQYAPSEFYRASRSNIHTPPQVMVDLPPLGGTDYHSELNRPNPLLDQRRRLRSRGSVLRRVPIQSKVEGDAYDQDGYMFDAQHMIPEPDPTLHGWVAVYGGGGDPVSLRSIPHAPPDRAWLAPH